MQIARDALHGVGDAGIGEWAEQGRDGVIHLRRRLSEDEMESFGVREIVDVRGTDEYLRRYALVVAEQPALAHLFA